MDPQIKSPQEAPKDVPRHEVPLPSRGWIYPEDHPLCDKEDALIRAMTIHDEDLLSSEPLVKNKQIIDEFIKSALGSNVDASVLCMGDREAIMFAFRATGYGSEYTVRASCPSCKDEFPYTFDLHQLQVRQIEVAPVVPHQNLFEVAEPLPGNGARIQFSIMTGAMEAEVTRTIDALAKKASARILPEVSLRLYHQVQSVNGNKDRAFIRKFVDGLSAKDAKFLRTYIAKMTPKVEAKQELVCPKCGATEEVILPMDISFFFPED